MGAEANKNEEINDSENKEFHKNDEDNEVKDEDAEHSQNDESNFEELKKKIDELEKENSDMRDKYMRAMAELDNTRKRTAKEKADTIRRANRELLLSLLNFMDNFERAVHAGESDANIRNSEYYRGVELIHKQFIDFIHDHGVSEIDSLGKEFDPNVHEALTMIESPDCEVEKVVEVYAKGYKLNDELLRTAKVIVGKPSSSKKEDKEAKETKDNKE